MKVLVILCGNEFSSEHKQNIQRMSFVLNNTEGGCVTTDWCLITSNEAMNEPEEEIVNFKYKIVNPNLQLRKVCDFITENFEELTKSYDWFIKARPDLFFHEDRLEFESFKVDCINARARIYYGPKVLRYGLSLGDDRTKDVTFFRENEEYVVLDDQLYIFSKEVVEREAFVFSIPHSSREDEWKHTFQWNRKQIGLNVINFNLTFTKYGYSSGGVNWSDFDLNEKIHSTETTLL